MVCLLIGDEGVFGLRWGKDFACGTAIRGRWLEEAARDPFCIPTSTSQNSSESVSYPANLNKTNKKNFVA